MEDAVADKIGEALRVAMMHSTAAMVLSDPHLPDCPMVAVNPAFTQVTGYTAEEAVGRNCRFLQGSQDRPRSGSPHPLLAEGWAGLYRVDRQLSQGRQGLLEPALHLPSAR